MADDPANPIQVLLVVDEDVFERLGPLVRHLCVGLVDEPVRVTVLTRQVRQAREEFVGPSRLLALPKPLWPWSRWSAEEVLEELELEPPDVVHCLSPDLAEWVAGWSGAWGSTLAVQLMDLRDVQQFCGLALPSDTIAIATTPSLEQALSQSAGGPRAAGLLRRVPLGLPAEPEPACCAEPGQIPAVLLTAPLTRNSGVDTVLRSLQAVIKAGQDVQLFVLSAGPAEHSFRRLVEQLGLVAHVTFAGPLGDWSMLQDAMENADFYVVPSVSARFTFTTLTALARGMAVIAPTGTTEDYLVDDLTAALFDPNRPKTLTERWLTLVQDREAARRLAASALDYVRQHHQATSMAASIAALYREAATARAGAGRTTT